MPPSEEGPLSHLVLLQALAQMPEGLSLFDTQDRLVFANRCVMDLWQLPAALMQAGTPVGDIRDAIPGEAVPLREAVRRGPAVQRGQRGVREWRLLDGRHIQVRWSRLENGFVVGLHQDVTEQRTHEQQLAHLALHEALTGLPNRLNMLEALTQQLPRTARGEEMALISLNLDRFKDVNDTLGLAAGDELLKQVAQRLKQCVRQSDVVGHLGGDDFVVLQTGSAQPGAATALGRRLIEALSQPYEIGGQTVLSGVCVGAALAPFDGDEAETLLKNSALALHRAKEEGRGLLRYFEPGMDQRMRAKRQIDLDLRSALDDGQFDLMFQPLVSLANYQVIGVEALIRWDHPQRGRISPLDFIPLAEETGLIVPIGRWVLSRACELAAQWPASVRVAVNVSPVQFRSTSLMQDVQHALNASGLPADRLELEITEAVLMQDSSQAVTTLHALRDLGVRISMDDFGTGYSSLSYLRRFPLDKIKIDRSFVIGVDTSDEALAVVESIRHLASALGMSTTVEGVETRAQLDAVAKAGCSEEQGYFFSKPRPAADIAGVIDAGFAPSLGDR